MKTQDTAVNYVYEILMGTEGLGLPAYKYTKPTVVTPDEFLVINALPITAGILQMVVVNVNYYVKDKLSSLPDIEKLECKTADIMTLLQEVSVIGIMIDFESQEYHRETSIDYHYSNVRLKVKLIN